MNFQKLMRDPIYGPLYAKHGLIFCLDAGYFEDNVSDEDHGKIRFVPQLNLKNPQGALLLATGAMCPIHIGHMRMLEIAAEELMRRGKQISGALLSPAHDEYILSKTGTVYPYGYRVPSSILNKIHEHPYLGISHLEMDMFGAVNFTEVYYQHTLLHDDVWFVCGSDNARFCLAFKNIGKCIVVKRPGYELEFELFKSDDDGERILFVEGDSVKISSSEIRNNNETSSMF